MPFPDLLLVDCTVQLTTIISAQIIFFVQK